MNHQNRTRNQALFGSQYPNSILNQILQQPASSQRAEAALQPQSLLSFIPNHRSGGNILAAAVQQQLVATLANSNIQLLQPMHLQRASQRFGARDLGGSLLSVGEQDALIRHFPSAAPVGQAMLPSLTGQQQAESQKEKPQGVDHCDAVAAKLLRGPTESSSKLVSASGHTPEAATQLPCQARGMPADHNSSVSMCVSMSQWVRSLMMPNRCNFLICLDIRQHTLKSPAMHLTDNILYAPIHLVVLRVSNLGIVSSARNQLRSRTFGLATYTQSWISEKRPLQQLTSL